ncbi:ATP-binding cassette (ABC) Superfamily [Phytophthora palmivora]|uniref:ATP-binding cassette (ABC) Superfamily n=1 Tax=Phytophthora palmivora TaxID=4796 RepID=A0A2P4XDN8_9STRA|nr:ATP-binding cassette (ABC) Superfamily [Phytophthora palmivora]
MITGSESEEDTTGSTKDPTPAQDAPVDDSQSPETKAAPASTPAKNLTLDEGKARAQAAIAASEKRASEGVAAAKEHASPGSPIPEPSIAKGFRSLFDSSDEEEEEGAVSEPQEISNDLDERQECYQAAQLQGAPAPPTPVYPRGYYPPDAGSGSPMFLEHLKPPRGLNHGRTSRGAYERALPENTATQTQAEDLFWRWVSLKNFTVHEWKELREDRLLCYVLDQRDLRIEFAHLIAKRQLYSVMEGV